MNAPDDMDELYSGGDSAPEKSIDQEEQETSAEEGVAPVSLLQGHSKEPLKVGDEVVVKITGIHGNDATFVYSDTPPGEIGEGEEAGPKGEKSPDQEIDEMDNY